MELRLQKNQDIYSFLIKELTNEAYRLMNQEFGYIFNNTNVKIYVETISDSMLLYHECVECENMLTKEQILTNIKRYENTHAGTSMYVTNDDYFINDTYQIRAIKLVFYKPGVTNLLLHYLYNLPLFIEYMKYSVRHEIGHMIELLSCIGKSYEEMDTRRQVIQNAQVSHFRKWDNIRNNDCIDRMYEYYAMPQEQLANKYANVDVNRLINYNRILCNDVDCGTVINIDGYSMNHPPLPPEQQQRRSNMTPFDKMISKIPKFKPSTNNVY